MEFSLSTFIIQIVNFLVLIWILKRLFFAPLKTAIEHRRDEIKKSLDDAEKIRASAAVLLGQYESKIKEWDKEKITKQADLKKELELEKERRLKEIHEDFNKERQRLYAQEEKFRKESEKRLLQEASAQSLAFLTKLLSNFSSKETESRIIHMFFDKLTEDKDIKDFLEKESESKALFPIAIRSAFPLEESERDQLSKKFSNFIETKIVVNFDVDASLVAGIEVTVGSAVLRANLRDELNFFSAVSPNGI